MVLVGKLTLPRKGSCDLIAHSCSNAVVVTSSQHECHGEHLCCYDVTAGFLA